MSSSPALKQPAGLVVLFSAELWERFGFYAIQTLMVLYLTQKLAWSDKNAYNIFSAFSALIYATPVIGGYLADRLLGFKQAIYIGTILYILGYGLLSTLNPHCFHWALALLICGNGFFKPNVSSLLGTLYEKNDARRDSGFTWFYMGINIGSFFAPIICTALAVHLGWPYGFLAACVGMIIALMICYKGFPYLVEKEKPVNGVSWRKQILFYMALLLAIIFIAISLDYSAVVSDTVIGIAIAGFGGLLIVACFEKSVQQRRLIALIILMIFSIFFWALYVQTFSSLTLFTERNVDRHVWDYVIPTAMFGAINPFFIIILSPLLARLWLILSHHYPRANPSTATKFALALLLVGSGFLTLVWGMHSVGLAHKMPAGFLVANYFLQTVGELALSPIGLAAVTALAPPRLLGFVMGLWFLSLSAAYAVGGKIADLTAIPSKVIDIMHTASIYQNNFWHFGLCSVGIGVLLIFSTPFLKRMMREII